eukprot:TRINITY_DN3781_c0_g1_i1.p1 TRINITY_DN3781_c0_g1~~TRINITY_DN3781_c0_g1_i1.p1  ORF type:complete len:250 (+),score=36.82 TRINITY_DN3781_c0_g1_i1:90-752(+)
MPECPVCLVSYATEPYARLPRLLGCGHTLCSKCLSMVMKRRKGDCSVSCPCCRALCREPERGFPLNFALVEALQEAEEEKVTQMKLPLTPTKLESRNRRTMTPPPAGSRRSLCAQSRSSTPPATPLLPQRCTTGADIVKKALKADAAAAVKRREREKEKEREKKAFLTPSHHRVSVASIASPEVREVYKLIERACNTPVRNTPRPFSTTTPTRYSQLLRR